MRRKEATHVHRRRHISNRHLSDKYYYAGEHETVTDIRLTQYNAEALHSNAARIQGDYIRIDYDFSQACIHTTFHALYPPIPSYYSKHMETGITDSTLRYIITAFPQKRKFKKIL